MRQRILKLAKKHSLFLFGPRNTGKSTLVLDQFPEKSRLLIDLLDPLTEDKFAKNPTELIQIVEALPKQVTHIIIDEAQKVPRLLDVIHKLIESTNKIFIMTGSSARKLKRGSANLLAGRAFVYNLYPFTYTELGDKFSLERALQWGMLPQIWKYNTLDERKRFLQSYSLTYLKEEVWGEQLVRKLDPFRKFIEVAAQMNGKVINYSKIARDVGVDDKTVREYYAILEDTLLGFYLNAFQHSFRKRLNTKPKFYFFDTGVTRALNHTLSIPAKPQTSDYGMIFEHFVILEILKLAEYHNLEYRFSYLSTKDDAEIDLVVERPGKPVLFIEIKSTDNVTSEQLSDFQKIVKDFGACEAICLSKDANAKKIDDITVLPWDEGIRRFFGS